MTKENNILEITPVLPSSDIKRDVQWHKEKTGYEWIGGDDMYCILRRENSFIHLQWHADTDDDPLLGGSVIKIFVKDIEPIFEELVAKGGVNNDLLRRNTAWGTHEFGMYDPNNNSIFFVQDV
ncbi:glyoxalase/bleomycin resistance/extradiol dioxygenase family protein [Fulvivirga lutimaris]|uniref:glyoxalase/bleomycin resistance/extradiol dioxygenase family protein n=1 Tax=Fulvivirga lutimaris TaxID=1819566 RepID=UPI0012BB83D8|nr:glyoxalase/bleomycin resistance/extradiol dioxygenase family protein [Fulvivirga lutimaris]MTI41719.1 glyoxalase/bleomycin resistance/extradiol dioxygenase family protein [Fulvivirga lutimaris]